MRLPLISVTASVFIAVVASIGVPGAESASDPSDCVPASGESSPVVGATSAPSGVGDELLPDPTAEHTMGETVLLSGGEFVGDQARLTVLDAVRRSERDPSGAPQYAFLVEIEGLDPDTLPYNALDFAMIDDQDFAYQAIEGGQQPALGYGDLPHGRKVKGWLTFVGPEEADLLELEYSPAMALEPAYIRVRVP